MQNTKNTTTTNHALTLTKEIGKLWALKDITPFISPSNKSFKRFFDEDMGHDIGKLMFCGCANYVLDILAGDDTMIKIELRIASERVALPGYVELELARSFNLSAKYLVNNCPECPQMIAWVDAAARQLLKEYPKFAYIKKYEII